MPLLRRTTAGTTDLRDKPAYSLSEAARYVKLPSATLRTWCLGRDYGTSKGTKRWAALVSPASARPPLLSFWNLIEAHVLRGLRTEHGVSVKAVRQALSFAEKELQVQRLLLSRELTTAAGRLFIDRYGQLIDLSASGQIALRQVVEDHLRRVEWDEWKFPVRLYPFLSSGTPSADRPIAIDPKVAFGRPVVAQKGVTTSVIAERIDAGETEEALAADYDLSVEDILRAILYERAA
jgi:uncharacterized protein (DUF433 family)